MFARRLTRIAVQRATMPVRRMGGGHHEPVVHPKDGFEGLVRGWFPQDHQVALAIIGFYSAIFAVVKLWPSKKKAPAVENHAHSSSSDEVPSIESPEFENWLSTPGNLEKLCG